MNKAKKNGKENDLNRQSQPTKNQSRLAKILSDCRSYNKKTWL